MAVALLAGCGGGELDGPPLPAQPLQSSAAATTMSVTTPVTTALPGTPQAFAPAPSPSTSPSPSVADAASQAAVMLYRSAGSRQCEGGGVSLVALERQLSSAGVMPLSLACGQDGRPHTSACGTADGRILMVEVPAAQADAARGAGLQSLAGLPSAVRTACE